MTDTNPNSKMKSRLLIIGAALVMAAIAVVILILQPASVKADAAAASAEATARASAKASSASASTLPDITAANPGQASPTQNVAIPPDKVSSDDIPKPASTVEEQYKKDAEVVGMQFLKIYYNATGSDMETPLSYVSKLEPYATQELRDKLKEAFGGASAPEWSWVGAEMHDKRLNFVIEGACSLAPGQGFAPVFDEEKGGHLPCSYKQTVTGQDGKELKGSDIGIETKSFGNQSLKIVRENGSWKVGAIDYYGQ